MHFVLSVSQPGKPSFTQGALSLSVGNRMTGALVERKIWTPTCAGRPPYEDEDRSEGDASGNAQVTSHPPDTRGKPGGAASLVAQEPTLPMPRSWTFSLQNPTFLLLKSPSLWHFLPAALGDRYTYFPISYSYLLSPTVKMLAPGSSNGFAHFLSSDMQKLFQNCYICISTNHSIVK